MLEIDYKAIGSKIKTARLGRGISRDILAERFEISSRHLANIEKGTAHPSNKVLFGLLICFRLSIDDIIYKDNETDLNQEISRKLSGSSEDQLKMVSRVVSAILE